MILEKLFQKDDEVYVFFSILTQLVISYIGLYFSAILVDNTIYDLFNIKLFISSEYFLYINLVFLFYLLINFLIKNNKNYVKHYRYFFTRDIKFFTISCVISLMIIIVLKNKISFLWIFNSYIITVLLLIFTKFILNNFYKYLIIQNIIQRNIAIIGNFKTIRSFIDIYKNKKKKSLIKCCIVVDTDQQHLIDELKIPCFEFNDDIFDVFNYHSIGQIWFELDETNISQKKIIFNELLKLPFDIKIFFLKHNENLLKLFLDKFKLDSFSEKRQNFLFYSLFNSRFVGLPLFLKIILDKFFSIIILIFTLPLLIVCSLLIVLEDGFPIIFKQIRTGWDGRKFKIYKLRTLKKEKFDKTVQVSQNDSRVLKVGRIIRRFSIDELPQIYNVIKGDMSIVGPRPHMIEHSKKYSNIIKNFLTRHKCNPGITGWAQVHGLRGATPNDELMKKRLEHDIWYLKNWSLALDFIILIRTVYAVLRYRVD